MSTTGLNANLKMKMNYVPNGTVLICPKCRKEMVKLNRELYSGEVIYSFKFDEINHKPEPNKQLISECCNERFGGYIDGKCRLYTLQYGWI